MSKRNSQGEVTKGSSQNGSESLSEQSPGDKEPVSSEEQEGHKKQKIAFGYGKKPLGKFGLDGTAKKGIQIKLGGSSQKPTSQMPPSVNKPQSRAVAAAFNVDDEDDEPEEMPPEARMRMRNIGRETPTSAGPNSFGKTKQGFCDAKKMFEKTMKKAMDKSAEQPVLDSE